MTIRNGIARCVVSQKPFFEGGRKLPTHTENSVWHLSGFQIPVGFDCGLHSIFEMFHPFLVVYFVRRLGKGLTLAEAMIGGVLSGQRKGVKGD